MDTLELLTTRRSTKSLQAPAPDELQLETMLQAASQVPDHGNLTPWRFIVINSEAGKTRLHQALLKAVDELNLGEDTRAKTHKVVNLAPMIIAFNCGEKEKILGFIMVGTAENACHHGAKNTDSTAFTEIW